MDWEYIHKSRVLRERKHELLETNRELLEMNRKLRAVKYALVEEMVKKRVNAVNRRAEIIEERTAARVDNKREWSQALHTHRQELLEERRRLRAGKLRYDNGYKF